MVLGSVEYIDPLNTPTPIPVVYGEEVEEISHWYWCVEGSSWGNPSTRISVTIQLNTDTIWMETGINHSSQWAEL